jgi:hypothetical protein
VCRSVSSEVHPVSGPYNLDVGTVGLHEYKVILLC